jgi:drug/metabolite transporter (DMT)-like permease
MIKENLTGILFMILSMAAFAVEDIFIKLLSNDWPVAQILMYTGLVGTFIFVVLAKRQGAPIFTRDLLVPTSLFRMTGDLFGSLAFVTAISLVDMSLVAAILQATPIVVTMAAALLLGEQVGWRRWSAIIVGLLGVLLVLRPGLDGFEPAALLAVFAVLMMALRDMSTRIMTVNIPSMTMGIYGFVMLIVAGLILAPFQRGFAQPDAGSLLFVILAGVTGSLGYFAVIRATRVGDVSVISPFRYSRLVFALILAVLVLGERPDHLTLLGAAIIVGSGMYTFLRERKLAAKAR